MKVILFLTVLVCFVACVYTQKLSTAFPEICRVMSLYRTCADQDYRIACSNYGNCSTDCVGGMVYVPTDGICLQGTNDGEHVWAYALEACSWYNGQLFIVKDALDAALVQASHSNAGTSHSNTFVGALNVGKTNIWVHLDGTLVDGSFWINGQSTPTESGTYQCMYVDSTKSYKQYYEGCTNNYSFMCSGSPV